jgi:trans-aconitate 2-methyltransferase
MPWNPDTYNKFKNERYRPFYDLISHVTDMSGMDIIDLGCGTGELTAVLAERFSVNKVLGIDTSAEMLAKAPQANNLSFQLKSIEEQAEQPETWDLIVANASLQWADDHWDLFPKIISKLNKNGQLAIQLPSQTENLLNKILLELVQEPPLREALNGWARLSPVLSLDEYTDMFFKNGADNMILYQKVYPIIAQSSEELFEFISGSALVPYMERLNEPIKTQFVAAFKERISRQFPTSPSVYAFKRMILYANFG